MPDAAIIFGIILGIPLLGLLLYVADVQRRSARSPGGRLLARRCVLVQGLILGACGILCCLLMIAWMFWTFMEGTPQEAVIAVMALGMWVFAGLLMLWTGQSALRVFLLPEPTVGETMSLGDVQASEQLRLSAGSLLLVPFVLLGAFGILVAVPLLLWVAECWTSRRAREAQFLMMLALAVRHELPLADEVEAFEASVWSRRPQRYADLANRLREGRPLGESLVMSRGVLSQSLSREIAAAEAAGDLPAALQSMATRQTALLRRRHFDSSLALSLFYVWTLLATITGVAGFLMYYIVPKYKAIFDDFGTELPVWTVSLIRTSDALTGDFLPLMPLMSLPILACAAAATVYFVGWGNLNVPLLMRWFPRRDAPDLLRSLSYAVEASQPLPEVVDGLAQRHLRTDMQARLAQFSDALRRGEPLWQPLQQERFIRPPEADALAAAQRANNLPWAMRTLADSLDRGSFQRAQFWIELFKPTLVIGLGLLVGWIALAMFLPLVKLINDLC